MNRMTFPGLIDPHVHLKNLGLRDKEDYFLGTAAALAGGYTAIIDMPDNHIPKFSVASLQKKQRLAKKAIVANLGFYFGTMGDNIEEFERAVQLNVKGLKVSLDFSQETVKNQKKILRSIFKAWPEHLPIIISAEGETLETVIQTMKQFTRKVHISHIRTRSQLEQILEAKTIGLPITCGVTPHHLFLTQHDEKSLGLDFRIEPQLESLTTVRFLWKHLRAIDCIESDHTPLSITEIKEMNTLSGVPGLETTLPLLLTAVKEGRIELYDIIRLCHDGPARIFNLRQAKGTYIEVDLETKYTITNTSLVTTSGWSPFHGWNVVGKVRRTYIRDQKVFDNGQILAQKGFGSLV